MLDVLLGTQLACGFLLAGFLFGDWAKRKAEIKTARDMLTQGEALVIEYKAHLARLHEVDLTRAQKIVELANAVEAIQLRLEMEKRNK